jgi:hypothetical protein
MDFIDVIIHGRKRGAVFFFLSRMPHETITNIYVKLIVEFTYQLITISRAAHHSPLLDIGLSNCSPYRSIFGYSHPAPASLLRKSSFHMA